MTSWPGHDPQVPGSARLTARTPPRRSLDCDGTPIWLHWFQKPRGVWRRALGLRSRVLLICCQRWAGCWRAMDVHQDKRWETLSSLTRPKFILGGTALSTVSQRNPQAGEEAGSEGLRQQLGGGGGGSEGFGQALHVRGGWRPRTLGEGEGVRRAGLRAPGGCREFLTTFPSSRFRQAILDHSVSL